MPETKMYHVLPTNDGKWLVREEGAARADSLHKNMGSAYRRADELATAHDGTIRVHEDEEHNWRKEASERAIDTQIAGKTSLSPKDVAAQDDVPRGLEDLERVSSNLDKI